MQPGEHRGLWLSALLALTEWSRGTAALYQGGGLTILTQNRLDNSSNDGSAAILLKQPATYAEGLRSCQLLNEAVWDASTQDFLKTLNSSLSYQVFSGALTPDSLFWVNTANPTSSCSAINTQGMPRTMDCSQRLPTLCTQSAQLSPANSTLADNSARWQVQQAVGAGNGTVMTGYRDYHTWKFRGIRYTPAPQRFVYSTTPLLEPGTVNATLAGADCSQPIGEVTAGSSEDCLFMNIWTTSLPQTATAPRPQELKPVMVYFYGGGLTTGSGKNPNTDGTNLASRGDVVVVSVNYRVGIPGFLPFNDGVHKGNYAFSDQVTSLLWVQQYIQYFGGDANKVTIFGESAGAQSVHVLLGSAAAAGKKLFKGAIMQSDPTSSASANGWTWANYSTIDSAYQTGTMQVLTAANCSTSGDAAGQIGCLAKYSGFELVNLSPNFNGIVMDGTYVTDPHLILNRTGIASDIAVMTGTNRDEAGVFINAAPTSNESFATYYNQQVRNTSSIGPNFINTVPLTSFDMPPTGPATAAEILNTSLAIQTNGIFTCFDLAKSYTAARHNAFASTYTFLFNRTYSPGGYTRPWCDAPNSTTHPNGNPDAEYFKCHAGEQLFTFGTALRSGQPDRDGLDVPFMQLVVDYWAAFARAYDPNPDPAYLAVRGYGNTSAQIAATGRWAPVDAAAPTMRLLQWNGAQIPFVRGEQCRAIGAPLEALEADGGFVQVSGARRRVRFLWF